MHGVKLDPKTGRIIEKANHKDASGASIQAIEDSATVVFQPIIENVKAQLLPRVVLIIDHNICIIGLMCFPSIFQKSSKDAMAKGLCGDAP